MLTEPYLTHRPPSCRPGICMYQNLSRFPHSTVQKYLFWPAEHLLMTLCQRSDLAAGLSIAREKIRVELALNCERPLDIQCMHVRPKGQRRESSAILRYLDGTRRRKSQNRIFTKQRFFSLFFSVTRASLSQ